MADPNTGEALEPESSRMPTPPRKRQRTMSSSDTPSTIPLSRKGKACSRCHRLKVKCDSADRGMGTCSRCIRLGLQCANSKKRWPAAEESEEQQQQQYQQQQELQKHQRQTDAVIFKLERALEDILQNLNMPTLPMYAQTPIVEHVQSPRSTRQNSQEPTPATAEGKQDGEVEREVSPGPMRSLIEATRLNSLCSQLRSVKQRKKGGMRRMDSDLIAEKIITKEQAQQMFDLFRKSLSPYLFSASITEEATLESVRISSTVLFTAIMLVSSLHIAGHEQIHEVCHSRFLGLVSSAIFDRFHTLDDIRGLCVAALWQPDLSWKLSGICIRMATELNLQHAFYEAFYLPEANESAKKDNLEKTRLWYLLFVLDHQSSIAYGRPPVMAELRPIKDFEVFLNSSWCTQQDRALIAQVTGFLPLNRALEVFGLEPKRTMGGDDASVLTHLRFTEEARAWRERWRHLSSTEEPGSSNIFSGREVDLHHHFSDLVLHSLVLRGRSLDMLQDLPTRLRPLTLRAIDAAHSILQYFIDAPGRCEGIVGMPLYPHSMIAFAVVFLMKISHRWQLIGITVDPAEKTRPLIEGTVKLLRECKAGADHMVFSMANGFERMLKQDSRQKQPRPTQRGAQSEAETPASRSQWTPGISARSTITQLPNRWNGSQGILANNSYRPDSNESQQRQHQRYDQNTSPSNASHGYPAQTLAGISPFENWGFQDEEVWNFGNGYDLLAPGENMASSEMPFAFYDTQAQQAL